MQHPNQPIIVINYNLLSSVPYLYYLQKATAQKLHFNLSKAIYIDQNYINLLNLNADGQPWTWSTFFEAIQHPSEDGKQFMFQYTPPKVSYKLAGHTFYLDFQKHHYVYLNQVALWDILYHNSTTYDIYTTVAPQVINLPENIFASKSKNNDLYQLKEK